MRPLHKYVEQICKSVRTHTHKSTFSFPWVSQSEVEWHCTAAHRSSVQSLPPSVWWHCFGEWTNISASLTKVCQRAASWLRKGGKVAALCGRINPPWQLWSRRQAHWCYTVTLCGLWGEAVFYQLMNVRVQWKRWTLDGLQHQKEVDHNKNVLEFGVMGYVVCSLCNWNDTLTNPDYLTISSLFKNFKLAGKTWKWPSSCMSTYEVIEVYWVQLYT